MPQSRSTRSEKLFILGFLAPAALVYGGFVVWPLFQAFAFSLYRWRGISVRKTFIGIQNFVDLAHDQAFLKAAENNLLLLAVGGIATIILAVAVGHGVQSNGRISKTLRGLMLAPQMLSLVIVAVLWMFIFNPRFGLVTTGMEGLGLDRFVHTWLGDSKTALPSVGVAFLWYANGFYAMLFAAGIRGIPEEIKEAAELDGARGLKRFWTVTWPMLWSIKRVAVVHLTITVMNVFVLVFIMTHGGPDRATEMMLTYLYESAFTNYQFGYATAIAVVNFLIVMALSGLLLLVFRRNPSETNPAQRNLAR